MHLLQISEDGTLSVVDTESPLRGVLDAFEIAQTSGDGRYIADMGDGSYLPFQIRDGQQPQGGVVLGEIKFGSPYQQTTEGDRFRQDGSGAFPSLVPDVVGTEDQGGQTFDEYIPASERG